MGASAADWPCDRDVWDVHVPLHKKGMRVSVEGRQASAMCVVKFDGVRLHGQTGLGRRASAWE